MAFKIIAPKLDARRFTHDQRKQNVRRHTGKRRALNPVDMTPFYLQSHSKTMTYAMLYLGLCMAMVAIGAVCLGFAVMSHPLVIVGAIGGFGGAAYFGMLSRRESGSVNRNRMASHRQAAEFQSCIACGEPFGGDDGTAYYLMKRDERLGTASIHHRTDCLANGLELLVEQIQESKAWDLTTVTRIGRETYRYDMDAEDGFWFVVANDDTVNRRTLGFLRRYVENYGIVLVKFGGTDDRGESGRIYDRIPVLLSITSDIVKAAVAGDVDYAERRKAARTKMRRSLSVRCGDRQQCGIMSTYARDTALTARLEPVRAGVPAV